MKTILMISIFVFSGLAKAFPACECPPVTCPVCTHSENQTFYSEKCGDDGLKTRSCAKPKCVDNEDPKCVKAAAPAGDKKPAVETVGANDAQGRVIGAVKVVKGSVQITGADGTVRVVAVGDGIHEHDHVTTAQDGSALIEFEGGNKVHILNDTRMTVQEYDNSQETKRAVFNLLKGKIRNQVRQKYNGSQSRYEIITPGVVAGVRGTDFVVSEEKTDHRTTRFDTLEGSVYLNQRVGEKAVKVDKDQSISFSQDDDAYSKSADWSNSAVQGFFSPVHKLSANEAQVIARATDLTYDPTAATKNVKKKPEPIICKSPSGRLNQCSWHCANNPKRAKACPACVRSRCNANGEWAEPTKLPPGSDECEASGNKVGDCDY